MKRRRKPNKIKKYGDGVYGVQEMEVPETMSGMDVAQQSMATGLAASKASAPLGKIPGIGLGLQAGVTAAGMVHGYTQARDAQQDSRIVKGNIESHNRFAKGMQKRGLRNPYMTMGQDSTTMYSKKGVKVTGKGESGFQGTISPEEFFDFYKKQNESLVKGDNKMPDVIGSTMETGQIPIEIEEGEIMTDKNNIPKAVGTKKHKNGGTIAFANEGDVVYNTQEKSKREKIFRHLFKANVNGDPKSKEKIKQEIANLPSDRETPTTDPFNPTEGEGGVKTAKHGMVMSAEEGLVYTPRQVGYSIGEGDTGLGVGWTTMPSIEASPSYPYPIKYSAPEEMRGGTTSDSDLPALWEEFQEPAEVPGFTTPTSKKDYSPDKVIDYSYGDNLGLEGIPESHYNKPSASQIASKEYKSPFKYSSQEEFSNFIDNTGYQTTSSEGTPIETNRKNIPNKFISQEPINKVQPGALGTPVADAGYGMKEPELTKDLIGESAFKFTPSNKEFLSHYDPKKSVTEKATEKKLPFSEADFGQEMKRANNPLKYANVLHNLRRGAEEADRMTPRRFNPELMKYKDMSAADRAATLQAASLQNYQNRGKGLTAGQRQSISGQIATRAHKILGKLGETERARQKAIEDANVSILNQGKLQNMGLAMKKEDYDARAKAARDAYGDAAWKELSEKAQYAELGENRFRYDKNRSNMDKWAMQHLMDTGQMTFDAKGNVVFKGTNKTTA